MTKWEIKNLLFWINFMIMEGVVLQIQILVNLAPNFAETFTCTGTYMYIEKCFHCYRRKHLGENFWLNCLEGHLTG